MRPYFPIIVDSFREALASRVLWVLLAFITLLWLALVPFSVDYEIQTTLGMGEIVDERGFVDALVEGGGSTTASPAKHVWAQLDEKLQRSLSAIDESSGVGELRVVTRRLRTALNKQLKRDEFYDAPSWKRMALLEETRDLIESEPGTLSPEQTARRNRLLLYDGFHGLIRAPKETSTRLGYFWSRTGPLSMDRQQLQDIIEVGFLPTFTKIVVGIIGIFTAILVTSSIVPQTFEPGSIDLLFSKPVSRSLVFLTKYLGGCAFVLLNSVYFMVGLTFFVWLKLDMWMPGLLLIIPVFVFVFAIYYALSCLAGVVWRNAIICVVASILFWFYCFSIGLTRNFLDMVAMTPRRSEQIVVVGEDLLAAKRDGTVVEWSAEDDSWQPVFGETRSAPPGAPFASSGLVGPVYDSKHQQIVAIRSEFGRFGSGAGHLEIGSMHDHWKRVKGISVPPQTRSLFVSSKGEILVAGPAGIFELQGENRESREPFKVFGIEVPTEAAGESRFESIGPELTTAAGGGFAAALDSSDDRMLVANGALLRLLERKPQGSYEVVQERTLETEGRTLCGLAGKTALLAHQDGTVTVVESATLSTRKSLTAFKEHRPKQVSASPDGRFFAVLFHHRKLWLYDRQAGTPIATGIPSQGDITAVAFAPSGQLLIGDRFGRVSSYASDTFEREARYEGTLDAIEKVFRYGIDPLYTVSPKPAEMDNWLTYLISGEQTMTNPLAGNVEEQTPIVLDLWTPIWSNFAFIAVVLGGTCVYLSRKDF